jgi:hypothetical protein
MRGHLRVTYSRLLLRTDRWPLTVFLFLPSRTQENANFPVKGETGVARAVS